MGKPDRTQQERRRQAHAHESDVCTRARCCLRQRGVGGREHRDESFQACVDVGNATGVLDPARAQNSGKKGQRATASVKGSDGRSFVVVALYGDGFFGSAGRGGFACCRRFGRFFGGGRIVCLGRSWIRCCCRFVGWRFRWDHCGRRRHRDDFSGWWDDHGRESSWLCRSNGWFVCCFVRRCRGRFVFLNHRRVRLARGEVGDPDGDDEQRSESEKHIFAAWLLLCRGDGRC